MTTNDIVLIIGAIGSLVTVVAAAYVSIRKIKGVKADVQAVHQIVNQQRSDLLAYQEALIDALVAKGIDVPPDKSRLKDQ